MFSEIIFWCILGRMSSWEASHLLSFTKKMYTAFHVVVTIKQGYGTFFKPRYLFAHTCNIVCIRASVSKSSG